MNVFIPRVKVQTVKPFKMARYVMISKDAKRIGWDFPFVSLEQKNRFGLNGYVAAYILPQGFETTYPGGVEIAEQKV